MGLNAESLVIMIMAWHFVNAHPVSVDDNSPQQQVSGTPTVDKGTNPTGSPTYPLNVVAALSNDRTKLILSVVNPTEESQPFTPQIRRIKLRSAGKLSQIADPSVNANNEAGEESTVATVETAQPALRETVHVPSLGVSVYEFEIETARPFGKNPDAGHVVAYRIAAYSRLRRKAFF